MELHTLAKMEGVRFAVFRELIALCQCRREGPVRFKTEQAVINVGQNQVVSPRAALLGLGKETVGLIRRGKDGGILVSSSGRRHKKRRNHYHCQKQCEKFFHVFPPI